MAQLHPWALHFKNLVKMDCIHKDDEKGLENIFTGGWLEELRRFKLKIGDAQQPSNGVYTDTQERDLTVS